MTPEDKADAADSAAKLARDAGMVLKRVATRKTRKAWEKYGDSTQEAAVGVHLLDSARAKICKALGGHGGNVDGFFKVLSLLLSGDNLEIKFRVLQLLDSIAELAPPRLEV